MPYVCDARKQKLDWSKYFITILFFLFLLDDHAIIALLNTELGKKNGTKRNYVSSAS